jgi:DNA-binding response OmpR family regulator
MMAQAERRIPTMPRAAALGAETVRVLVVDDDERLRELLGLHLWHAGYDVRLAEDVVEAGHMIFKSTPDVMIVDANLPYMSGYEFVAAVRADRTIPFISVIFLAAHMDSVTRAREFGAACLLKPIQPDKLLVTVASCTLARPPLACAARPEPSLVR